MFPAESHKIEFRFQKRPQR